MKKIFWIFIFIGIAFFSISSQEDSTLKTINNNDLLVSETPNTEITAPENTSWIDRTVNWYMQNLNYFTVTLLMTIESSFIPFPSEVVVPPAAYAACDPNSSIYVTDSNFINISLVVLFATIGALLGGLANYYLAYFLGRPIVYKFADSKLGRLCLLNKEKVQKSEDYFVKHGNSSTFIGRLLPGIRQLISIPAGLAKMKLSTFLLYTCLGSCLWNIILAILGYAVQGQKDLINKYSHELSIILLLLGVLFVAYLVWQGVKSKKVKK